MEDSEEKNIGEIGGIWLELGNDLNDESGSDSREQTRLAQPVLVEVNETCKDLNALTKIKEVSKSPTYLETRSLSCSSENFL